MLKERRDIVAQVQARLHESEMAVEAALTAIGRLAITLPEARRSARVSATAGQAAFDSVAAAMTGIVQVRGYMVETHGHLEATRGAFRLPVVDTGAGYEKPSFATPAGHLELIEERAA